MGLKDWRKRHSMRDPVRGEFRVTDRYCAHPGSSSFREMLTGVVTGPGVPHTPGEHLADGAGRWVGHEVLPVLVDRGDPTSFVILWNEVPKPAPRAEARRESAETAARLREDAARAGQAPDHPSPDAVPAPDWVREMLADVLPGVLASGGPSIILDGGTQVINLTGGHPAAGEPAFDVQHSTDD